jgi:hypothetical protein
MARVAYILLCHSDPIEVIEQARLLSSRRDYVVVHYDRNAPAKNFQQIYESFIEDPHVIVMKKRVRCGWGEWSLVQASLNAVRVAFREFERASHFYMVSADCMPIKSAKAIHDFLDRNDQDFIECEDFFRSDWIQTGIKEERLIYRHFFNERKYKKLFYWMLDKQRRFKLERPLPKGLDIRIGSQWWCLRRDTISKLLDLVKARPEILRFFRTTWIPDETFFQTLVYHVVPRDQIRFETPTFLLFSDYGMPAVFYNDHFDLLIQQPELFARKVSRCASGLKNQLAAVFSSDADPVPQIVDARRLLRYAAQRGRVGLRYVPRAWEDAGSLGRSKTLLVLACKKWHVAKRVLERARDQLGLTGYGYLFDEDGDDLPDLGGIGHNLQRRERHRRAFLRLLYDSLDTDRLLICIDPSRVDLLDDFYTDRCTTKVLEIVCNFSDDYLLGHAQRVRLAQGDVLQGPGTALLPSLRNDFAYESDRIRDGNYPNLYHYIEDAPEEESIAALAAFFGIHPDKAAPIVAEKEIFWD